VQPISKISKSLPNNCNSIQWSHQEFDKRDGYLRLDKLKAIQYQTQLEEQLTTKA
jgi:hypothetical protein